MRAREENERESAESMRGSKEREQARGGGQGTCNATPMSDDTSSRSADEAPDLPANDAKEESTKGEKAKMSDERERDGGTQQGKRKRERKSKREQERAQERAESAIGGGSDAPLAGPAAGERSAREEAIASAHQPIKYLTTTTKGWGMR